MAEKIRRIYHESDFDFVWAVPLPEGMTAEEFFSLDFAGEVSGAYCCSRKYRFSKTADGWRSCEAAGQTTDEQGVCYALIRVICHAHGLPAEPLMLRLAVRFRDPAYPDGIHEEVHRHRLAIELVRECERCEADAQAVTVTLPFAYVSAYELAVEQGYEGTRAEYLSALASVPQVTEALEGATRAIEDNTAAWQQVEPTALLLSDLAEGKKAVAEALTKQGVPTQQDATFADMAEGVRKLYLPHESEFWQALGYTSAEDFGGVEQLLQDMRNAKDNWDRVRSGEITIPQWRDTLPSYGLPICPMLDTSGMNSTVAMFQGIRVLAVPLFDLSSATETFGMFNNASLVAVPQFDMHNVGICYQMFMKTQIQSVPALDTRKVSSAAQMFQDCSRLHTVEHLDLRSLARTDSNGMFTNCSSLKFCHVENLRISLLFTSSPLLQPESVAYMVANAINTSAITITLHETAYNNAMADADVLAALEAHPLVSLAKA